MPAYFTAIEVAVVGAIGILGVGLALLAYSLWRMDRRAAKAFREGQLRAIAAHHYAEQARKR